jgi:very-short-patch-repair endonuclease
MRKNPTPTEKALWTALRDKRWGYAFRRQHPIGPYITDIVCLEAKLIIEVDGEIHLLPANREHDSVRDEYSTLRGYRVKRFQNAEVIADLPRVLEEIRSLLTE